MARKTDVSEEMSEVKTIGEKLKDYPQIERLIVADHNVAKAKSDLKEKRGIYIPYDALIRKIKGKEE